jgi:integrase
LTRRDNGQGSITQRADGRWQGCIRFTDATGRRKRAYIYGRTKAEVRAKLRDASRRVEDGRNALDAASTIGEYAAIWEAGPLAASDRKATTREWYVTQLRVNVVPHLGTIRLDRLRPSHIEALMGTLRASGKSPSTARGIYTVIRQVLDVAVRDGLLATNPAAAVSRPRVDKQPARVMDTDETSMLLAAASGHRLHALLVLLAFTGLRRGEALALRWEDVDTERGTMTVRGTLARVGGSLVVQTPKSRSSRVWPLAAPVVEALRAHRVVQAAERLRMGQAWTDSGHVFTSDVGTPLDPRNVYRLVRRFADQAGVPGVHPHTLRHSAATAALGAGVPLTVVSQMLGHSSVSITGDVYSHVLDGMKRDAADAIAAAFGAPERPSLVSAE